MKAAGKPAKVPKVAKAAAKPSKTSKASASKVAKVKPSPIISDVDKLLESSTVSKSGKDIEVNVDYQIVEQYSKHLYTNPRKAVEELACNSYDAGATQCWIQTPAGAGRPLLVLDNGRSMDINELRDLWYVAKSPKSNDPVHRIIDRRHQIGKFGVGKLAAFALGSRLTHIAHKDGVTRIVSVDLAKLKEEVPPGQRGPRFAVLVIQGDDLEATVGPLLGDLPKPWTKKWDAWTLAVVDQIDVENLDKPLDHTVLKRMISTALPVTAEFVVYLDKSPVPRRTLEDKEVVGIWKATDPGVIASVEAGLRRYHAELGAISEDDVPDSKVNCTVSEIDDPVDNKRKIPALKVPGLGPVAGQAIGTKDILTTPKLDDRGYLEHGFFVRVHDKLLNPEDNTFGIPEHFTYKFWHRCQIHVEVPGLDAQILVQRNAVAGRDSQPDVLREVLRGMFNFVRSKVKPYVSDAPELAPGPLFDRLTKHEPALQAPILEGLEIDDPRWTPADLAIDTVEAGNASPPASFNSKTGHIEVNYSHPFPRELELEKGKGKALDEVLGSFVLVAAYLRARNVPDETVAGALSLLDAVSRAAVNHIQDEFLYQKERLIASQKKGDAPFEEAICDALVALGVGAKPEGGSGKVDGVIKIIQNAGDNAVLSMEAKGGDTKVNNARADVATLSSHCKKRGAKSVVLVAKEDLLVVGPRDKEQQWTQLVTNCRDATPVIVIVPLEGLVRLLELHNKNPFSREQLARLLTEWHHPGFFIDRVEKEWQGQALNPPSGMKFDDLLKVIDNLTEKKSNETPHVAAVNSTPPISEWGLKDDELWGVLTSLQRFCRNGLRLEEGQRVWLKYEPKLVLREFKQSLERQELPVAGPLEGSEKA